MMTTFADKVIAFHQHLDLSQKLPLGIKVMNPYRENPEVYPILESFYHRFFEDNEIRRLIVGINPGRLGAGATGIPFTDTKRLEEFANIRGTSFQTHEPSSVFVYDMIEAFGGPAVFYKKFYINSVCALGFVIKNKKQNWVNCNYYDFKSLYQAVKPFIISTLKKQIDFGIDTSVCYSLGKKNGEFLAKINNEEKLFDKIVSLPHPRYIVQYKSKQKELFIEKYLEKLVD